MTELAGGELVHPTIKWERLEEGYQFGMSTRTRQLMTWKMRWQEMKEAKGVASHTVREDSPGPTGPAVSLEGLTVAARDLPHPNVAVGRPRQYHRGTVVPLQPLAT